LIELISNSGGIWAVSHVPRANAPSTVTNRSLSRLVEPDTP
jgi:hypothetical protein